MRTFFVVINLNTTNTNLYTSRRISTQAKNENVSRIRKLDIVNTFCNYK